MLKNGRTSIDDLDAIGNALAEEHLRLAAGGELNLQVAVGVELRGTGIRDRTGCSNNTCWDTIIKA